MPVALTWWQCDSDHALCTNSRCGRPSAECIERSSRNLTVGLVNNMPDGALEATERQFISLLEAASGEFSVSLSLYSLPGISRSETTQRYVDQHYQSVESLWTTELDGLIVTGREPLTSNLRDEPYWDSFVQVVEWARERTQSTIWSCLAAHAAVLHMDGIQRVRSAQKHSGIIDCALASNHLITANLPARFRMPHSRWNGLLEADLVRCGYLVLSRAGDAGVDCFAKQVDSLFVLFQGHPEYQSDTLLLEYRRDISRYLRGEISAYPNAPGGYFNRETLQELLQIEHKGTTRPQEETLAQATKILSKADVAAGWRSIAATIYGNWLRFISSGKRLRLKNQFAASSRASKAVQPVQQGCTELCRTIADSASPPTWEPNS